jgi:putative membrane-bound dehydrogenase-like protein
MLMMAAALGLFAGFAAAQEKTPDNVAPPGFTALFNGKDMTGWTEAGKPPVNWTAVDGVLTFSGKGQDLHSTEKFSNYILHIDWKAPKNGNSGVYLRGGNPQVEINDADNPKQPIWNGTSGGLYPDKAPIKRAAKPADEWNHFEIHVDKGVITVFTNGEKTIDRFEKEWKINEGTIGFQNHGTQIFYKNIYIKKLPAGVGAEPPAPTGARLAGVPDGKIVVAPKADRNIAGPQKPDEQKGCFVLPPGFEVELVAAEPLVINPVTMTVDDKGRIYVSESHTYRFGPKGSPVQPFSNPIVRLDPKKDGKGYDRVVVAGGFDDPVMGIAVKGDKLWATANNYLYGFDLAEDGKATNRKTLVIDKNKAWNPFGMFVLEWGPDGLLYLSVGNHSIDLQGPNGKLSGRGPSGIICRMKPDGSDMERLVHGLRVPYSFEYDSFGQLWLLSNGEGNPNRFVRVIDGVDYHCYSRGAVGNEWLAGSSPLAPPCLELPRGATTQLLRYYGASFPSSYQGSLLLCNWGAHGFNGPNRTIFRYVPDARGNIVDWEALLRCSDPRFRPSHVALDPDGNLLVSDWYGGDDESDMTGRIWRVRYTGKEKRPEVKHKLDSDEWSKDEYAISGLGSPHHLVREKSAEVLVKRGKDVVAKLGEHAGSAMEPLGAAGALWALARIGSAEAKESLAFGTKHSDWRVRRLSLRLLKRCQAKGADETAEKMSKDEDAAVRGEAALTLSDAAKARAALVAVLEGGAEKDAHLRYEAAAHLARVGDEAAFEKLLGAKSEASRLAGMIAADVACFESLPTKTNALAAVGKALVATKDEKDLSLLLTLAKMNDDGKLAPALLNLMARDDVSAAATAQALLLLRARSSAPPQVLAAAGKRLLAALDNGTIKIDSAAEAAVLLEVLEAEGPTPTAIAQLGRLLHPDAFRKNGARGAAHALARRYGTKASALAKVLWPLLDGRPQVEDCLEVLATLARVEEQPDRERWKRLLNDSRAEVRTEAVRWWRKFQGDVAMTEALAGAAPLLLEKNEAVRDDLASVLTQMKADANAMKKLGLAAPQDDRDELGREALKALAAAPADQLKQRAMAGRKVFERSACVACHTAVDRDTPLAPSLKEVARGQKTDYLVESVLYPSKVIKTGFESELVTTKSGDALTGLVKDDGKTLRIFEGDREVKLDKAEVKSRAVQKLSPMPEGLEKQMSRAEFLDLIAYLASLR